MVPPVKQERRHDDATVLPAPAALARGLTPYSPVSSLERIDPHADPEPLKLDWNESTIAPSPLVIERIQAFLGNTHHLNWYPDQRADELTERLTTYTGMRD
ncbi:MAG TPA: hypothetical protein EYN66_19170, partial [Myxococcales bacterium]|nr:hypothetical protein [Myxococcales bacterium]